MKNSITTSITLLLILWLITFKCFADDPKLSGKSTFTARCASCHRIGSILTGPDLTNVDKRRSLSWIIEFVHSSQTVIKKGDKDAMTLFQQFNKIQMPDHQDLADNDIKNIVEYIKVEAVNASKNNGPFATPNMERPNFLPITKNDSLIIISYLVVVGMLVTVLYFGAQVTVMGKK